MDIFNIYPNSSMRSRIGYVGKGTCPSGIFLIEFIGVGKLSQNVGVLFNENANMRVLIHYSVLCCELATLSC